MFPVCLSIAGFDGSGGAGMQADLKTFSALGCYGMTVLTALPVQNTQGVQHCYALPLNSIEEQLTCLFDDIKPSAIKIGMLFSEDIIQLVSAFLQQHAQGIPVIIDPVMVAKSGDPLLEPSAVQALKQDLLPFCTLMTPNLPEAEVLVGPQPNLEQYAAALTSLTQGAVLVKGGHQENEQTASDLLKLNNGKEFLFSAPRIPSRNTHGTGCTLSAAITSFIAQGDTLHDACHHAKTYLSHAIKAAQALSLGKGHGPVHHFYHLWPCHTLITDENAS